MNLRATYNKIAKEWHKDHAHDDWWIEGTNKFISFFKPGDMVLDIGCGAGTKSKYLMDRGFKVTGIDFSEEMIGLAKQEVPDALFQVLDLADIRELEGTFDGIFMQAVLLHVPKTESLKKVQEIAMKLKTNGFFYIAVKQMREDGVEEGVKEEDDYGCSYQRFFSYFTRDEIKKYFTDSGLTIVYEDVCGLGKTKWIQVVAQKK